MSEDERMNSGFDYKRKFKLTSVVEYKKGGSKFDGVFDKQKQWIGARCLEIVKNQAYSSEYPFQNNCSTKETKLSNCDTMGYDHPVLRTPT